MRIGLFAQPLRTTLKGLTIFTIVLLAFATSACISRHPAGIAPSTSPLPASYTVLGPTEATSCRWAVLFLPVSTKDTSDKIIEQLVHKEGGTALIGATIEHKLTQYPLVSSDCIVVKGLAVKKVTS